MQFSNSDLFTPDQIIRDILVAVGDEEMNDFTKGWYVKQIRRCLTDLEFDSKYKVQNQELDVPTSLRFEVPSGAFNVKAVYVHQGTDCEIKNLQPVYTKDRFQTKGNNNGFTANYQDDLKGPYIYSLRDHNDDIYYNAVDGWIHLSDGCAGFNKVIVVYNGISTKFGETPLVPEFFYEAVKKYVELQVYGNYRHTKDRYTFYQSLYLSTSTELYGPTRRKLGVGAWADAVYLAKELDQKWYEDYVEYINQGNY